MNILCNLLECKWFTKDDILKYCNNSRILEIYNSENYRANKICLNLALYENDNKGTGIAIRSGCPFFKKLEILNKLYEKNM